MYLTIIKIQFAVTLYCLVCIPYITLNSYVLKWSVICIRNKYITIKYVCVLVKCCLCPYTIENDESIIKTGISLLPVPDRIGDHVVSYNTERPPCTDMLPVEVKFCYVMSGPVGSLSLLYLLLIS